MSILQIYKGRINLIIILGTSIYFFSNKGCIFYDNITINNTIICYNNFFHFDIGCILCYYLQITFKKTTNKQISKDSSKKTVDFKYTNAIISR